MAASIGRLDQMLRTTEQRRKQKNLIEAAPLGRLDLIEDDQKKKAFDRGGPVWPPRSNAEDRCLGRGSVGA